MCISSGIVSAQADAIAQASPAPSQPPEIDVMTGQQGNGLFIPNRDVSLAQKAPQLSNETAATFLTNFSGQISSGDIPEGFITSSAVPSLNNGEDPRPPEVAFSPSSVPQLAEDVFCQSPVASKMYSLPSNTPVEESTQAVVGELGIQHPVAVPNLVTMRDRWLYQFLATTDMVCHPDKRSVRMYAQILSTYPGMMAQGRDHLPPIIHPLQLAGGGEFEACPKLLESDTNVGRSNSRVRNFGERICTARDDAAVGRISDLRRRQSPGNHASTTSLRHHGFLLLRSD